MFTNEITHELIADAYSYRGYRELISGLLEQHKTTGPVQTDDMLQYALLNQARMNRIDKTFTPDETIVDRMAAVERSIIFLTITEGWCGDAAQIVPVIEKLAQLNPLFSHKLILRDENLPVMDQFLTNGKSRSIPIIVLLDANSLEALAHWGPRPAGAQQLIDALKARNADFDEVKEKLHGWYAKDKGSQVANEFLATLEKATKKAVQV